MLLRRSLLLLAAGLLCAACSAAEVENLLRLGNFEQGLRGIGSYKSFISLDSAVKHSGTRSLNVVAPEGGTAFLAIEDLDMRRPMELSAWVLTDGDSKAGVYLDVERAEGGRAKRGASEIIRAPRWTQVKARIDPTAWQPGDGGFAVHCFAQGTAWFDDLVLRVLSPEEAAAPPETPGSSRGRKPPAKPSGASGARVVAQGPTSIKLTDAVVIDSAGKATRNGANDLTLAAGASAAVSVKIDQAGYYGLGVEVEDAEGKAGPQVALLMDDRILGASSFVQSPQSGHFSVRKFAAQRIEAGEHKLRICSVQQAVGKVRNVTLQPVRRAPEKPVYSFILFNDLRLGADAHSGWLAAGKEAGAGDGTASAIDSITGAIDSIATAVRFLQPKFVVAAGGLTWSGSADQATQAADLLGKLGTPWYACLGGSDAMQPDARTRLAAAFGKALPGGKTWYAFEEKPLRFIVLDASWMRTKAGQYVETCPPEDLAGYGMPPRELEWLEAQLSGNVDQKTVLIVNRPVVAPAARPGAPKQSDAGLVAGSEHLLLMLERHTQVVAVLSGTAGGDAVVTAGSAVHVQNASLGRFPFVYKQVTVYPSYLEISTHQLAAPGLAGTADASDAWQLGTSDDLYCEVPM